MTDSVSLIDALDGLQRAIRDRDEAQQSANHFMKLATKLDGEVARLSGVVVALLGAPSGKVTVKAPAADAIGPKATVRILELLKAGSPAGMPTKELLAAVGRNGVGSSAPLGSLARRGHVRKLPNGNWAAV